MCDSPKRGVVIKLRRKPKVLSNPPQGGFGGSGRGIPQPVPPRAKMLPIGDVVAVSYWRNVSDLLDRYHAVLVTLDTYGDAQFPILHAVPREHLVIHGFPPNYRPKHKLTNEEREEVVKLCMHRKIGGVADQVIDIMELLMIEGVLRP